MAWFHTEAFLLGSGTVAQRGGPRRAKVAGRLTGSGLVGADRTLDAGLDAVPGVLTSWTFLYCSNKTERRNRVGL